MVEEFDLPSEIIDRKVTKMKMISPSNREVDVGKTLNEREYIGMCRREVFDDYLRQRAVSSGTQAINGLVMGLTQKGPEEAITLRLNDFSEGGRVRVATALRCAALLWPCMHARTLLAALVPVLCCCSCAHSSNGACACNTWFLFCLRACAIALVLCIRQIVDHQAQRRTATSPYPKLQPQHPVRTALFNAAWANKCARACR